MFYAKIICGFYCVNETLNMNDELMQFPFLNSVSIIPMSVSSETISFWDAKNSNTHRIIIDNLF